MTVYVRFEGRTKQLNPCEPAYPWEKGSAKVAASAAKANRINRDRQRAANPKTYRVDPPGEPLIWEEVLR